MPSNFWGSLSSSRAVRSELGPARRLKGAAFLVLMAGCVQATPVPPPGRSVPVQTASLAATSAATTGAGPSGEGVSVPGSRPPDVAPQQPLSVEPPPAPPVEKFDPALPTEVPVAGDLVAQVAHGAVGNRRVIVYLHGVCGDVHKFRAWTDAAIHFGTVVAVLGDDKCKDAGRYKWGFGVERTDRRIVAAVKAVSAVRSAPLDLEAITLVGYSQGSARAEALVRAFPSRYRRAILVAGPKEHTPASFHDALGIAMVGGGRDLKTHLQESAVKAAKAGVRARYFELPGARHGEYGAEAVKVMGAALSWVFVDGTLTDAVVR